MSGTVIVVIFSEGFISDIKEMTDVEHAYGFSHGVTYGANLYGAGSCFGIVLPYDLNNLLELPAGVEDQLRSKGLL